MHVVIFLCGMSRNLSCFYPHTYPHLCLEVEFLLPAHTKSKEMIQLYPVSDESCI